MEDINKDFLDMLEDIRRRPESYLARKSLTDLKSFFHGYYDGLDYVKGWCISYFEELHQWTAARYDGPATIGWARMIVFEANGEEKGFDMFFELLEEFVKEKKPVVGSQYEPFMRANLEDLLEMTRDRCGMFIGCKSLRLLDALIRGYTIAYNRYSDEPLDYLEGFQEWIEERYNMKPGRHSWAEIINFFECYDYMAFDRFYEHLDEFRRYKTIKGDRSEL